MRAVRPTGAEYRRILVGVLAALSLVVGACGSGDDASDDDAGDQNAAVEEEATPQRGGTLTFGVAAETTGGYCIPEAQLAASGITTAQAVFETLLLPAPDGGDPIPNLAESYQVSDDATEFTFVVREGITFHDDTPLDAAAVALTLKVMQGDPETLAATGRLPLLSPFVFQDVDTIEEVDDMTVKVTTSVPWPEFPRFLSAARAGVAAPAQLNSENCAEELIGTGPFELDTWSRNEEMVLTRNGNYWRDGEDGEPLPYLDGITFVPIPSGSNRIQALEGGTVDAAMFAEAREVSDLMDHPDDFVVVSEEPGQREVQFLMLNSGRPPFDDPEMRRHLAMAIDSEAINDAAYDGLFEIADQPFDIDVLGHVDDIDFPGYDPDTAADFFADKGVSVQFSYTSGPAAKILADEVRRQLLAVGVDVEVDEKDQASVINQALSGQFDMLLWRNFPGVDPDIQDVWWRTNSPANLGRIANPELDQLMTDARQSSDREERDALYQQVNEIFADEVYNVWMTWSEWAYAGHPEVHQLGDWTFPDGSPGTGMHWGWTQWMETWVEQ